MKKSVQFISVFVAVLLTLASYHSVYATASGLASKTYYVSPTGSDLNACTLSAPCKTFNKAMSRAVAGDVIVALAGTYNQQVVVSKSGITLEGRKAVIRTTAQNGIKVSATAQNVVVRGFTVTRTWSHAIFVEGKYVTIENNTVYYSILENGTISDGAITCGNTRWGSAIKAERGSSNVTIRNNTTYKNCGEGIAATMSKNVVIQNNTSYDNKSVNIYVDNSSYVQVLNNYAYCTKPSGNPKGIALGEEYYSGWGAQLHDIVISGNTVKNCSDGIIAFSSYVGGTLTNVEISNNYIPSGQVKGVSLDNNKNSNVVIKKNTYYNEPWIRSRAGVTLMDNIIGTTAPSALTVSTATFTATALPSPTRTASLPTQTSSPMPATPTSALPTGTFTALPTFSATPIPPTATFTATATLPEPTATFTITPTPEIPTSTPTFTDTPVPPTDASTPTP